MLRTCPPPGSPRCSLGWAAAKALRSRLPPRAGHHRQQLSIQAAARPHAFADYQLRFGGSDGPRWNLRCPWWQAGVGWAHNFKVSAGVTGAIAKRLSRRAVNWPDSAAELIYFIARGVSRNFKSNPVERPWELQACMRCADIHAHSALRTKARAHELKIAARMHAYAAHACKAYWCPPVCVWELDPALAERTLCSCTTRQTKACTNNDMHTPAYSHAHLARQQHIPRKPSVLT